MRAFTRILLMTVLLAMGRGSMAMQIRPASCPPDGSPEAPQLAVAETRQGGGLTLSQAVEQVRRQYKGRIVSAETEIRSGREMHIIKVLTSDGTVKTVRIPGRRI